MLEVADTNAVAVDWSLGCFLTCGEGLTVSAIALSLALISFSSSSIKAVSVQSSSLVILLMIRRSS